MSKKFWLKNVILHRSPGFTLGSFPPVNKLGEFLNVIWGPNAVGKSTLSRAMRFLIWKCPTSDNVEAEALMQTPDSEWNLSISQNQLKQKRLFDNQELTLPGRNDELSESYWFPLHELLQENRSQTATFLQTVRTQMQGGVDLDASREAAGGIVFFSRSTTSQAKRARHALDIFNEVIKKQSSHQNIQDEIASLEQLIEQGKGLSPKKAGIEAAIILLDIKKKIEDQEQELSSFPPAIKLIDKSSLQKLEDLLTDKTNAEGEVRSCVQTKNRLSQEFIDSAIEKEQLKDLEKPERISNQYDAYREALTYQKLCRKEFDVAKETLDEWEVEHSWLIAEPPEHKTLEAYVDRLQIIAAECEPIRCKVDAARRLAEDLGAIEDVKHPVNDLALLQIRLFDWIEAFWRLQGIPKNRVPKAGTKRLLLLLVLVIGSVTSWLGISMGTAFFVAGIVLILFSLLLLLPSSAKTSEYKKAEDVLLTAKREAEKLFIQLDKEGPSSWASEQCQTLIQQLNSEIAVVQQREHLNQRRSVATEHLDASKQKLREWNEKWQDAAKALGLKDDEARLEGAQFFHFANRLGIWSNHRLEYVVKEKALSNAEEETKRVLFLLQAELNSTESEITALKATRDSLVKRFSQALSLQTKLAENEGKLLNARGASEECQEALKHFWESIGLEFGNKNELNELVSNLEAWNKLRYSLDFNRSSYEKKTRENPKALELSHTYTIEDLNAEYKKIEQEQESLKAKWETLGGLRTTFDTLKFGSELSSAQLQKTQALADLEAFRQEQVMGMMISKLASDLKEEGEKLFQPQVVTQASTWLSYITNRRYELFANNQGFFAKDAILAKNYTMDELSSGTRIQLLFAIRMAFITMQEQSTEVNLPIFLDELLANSDDERALAIAQAIGKIAEKRQVFYFTAQRDEVEKLKSTATSEVTVIPLEDLTRGYRLAKTPLKPFVYAVEQVPLAIEDYYEYGLLLSAAGPSLWEPIESLHSWHLLTNSKQLYGYLVKGWRSIGQLASALGSQEPDLSFRISVLKRAQDSAKKGRCRLLHIQDLDDPALDLNRGTAYWKQIEEEIGTEGITGNALLQVKIPRFSDENYEILSNWLVEHGFASEQRPSTTDEILSELFIEFEELTVGSENLRVVQRWLDAAIG